MVIVLVYLPDEVLYCWPALGRHQTIPPSALHYCQTGFKPLVLALASSVTSQNTTIQLQGGWFQGGRIDGEYIVCFRCWSRQLGVDTVPSTNVRY